jgi:uncharacterized membrane protein YhhN
MKSKSWLYLFFADLLLELIAVANNWISIRFFTKPLLAAVLLTWFLFSSRGYLLIRYYIVAALFFSWSGDVLLLMEEKAAIYFIAGLSSFLLAHIIYILFFLRVRNREPDKKPWNIFIIIAVGIYAAVLFLFLNPHLGNLKIPVLAYTIVISAMLICAIHSFNISNKKAAYWCITGATLFVVSDSILAINKFYHHYPLEDIAIMFTYGLAQFAIANGCLQYLANTRAGLSQHHS